MEILSLWIDRIRRSGPANMAIDELLVTAIPHPVLRLYRWAEAEITFGYPQRWSDIQAARGTKPATRRLTGGGLVEHGNDLTITLSVPHPCPLARVPPAASYGIIHAAVLAALQLNEPAIRTATAADQIAGPACFSAPACGDLLLAGRKVLGGAQRRSRLGLLYQGSLQNLTPPENFAPTLAAALAHAVAPFDPTTLPDPTSLATTRYANPAWNQRR